MAENPKKLVRSLTKRGPHRVLRGDLALAGQPGVVFTPESGFGLPAVAFGHGWLTGSAGYRKTLEHLASWGIVAAAPDTARGPVPSHRGFAVDLAATLDICVGVRLGPGNISVHPDKLAFAGHGMGASAAVLAAANRDVAAVAALYPAPTSPRAESVAGRVSAPLLVVGDGQDATSVDSDARSLYEAAGDTALLRIVPDAHRDGLGEGRYLYKALGATGSDRGTQHVTRALLTGFLLSALTGDGTYDAFTDPDAEIPGTLTHPADDPQTSPATALRQTSQLLRT
ncbi:alpha/beta hydrolase [Rhodococcus rhodnii]|uniref:Dienelactone hydrolase domain-containing protein n=2 Tax=Rhodococcus rhodnii TaxID=38312 RepID=R7WV91_9NOCA|nr:dienelactone hydrolase family protein [Rhodococcus rhodnii]EOM78069.1 hypothetical protein Rrhod_0558 [Rhodococcus rhodnii LMG 5362]TXG90441.1 alpha/beta hydrolase [Rhodococcus rhodnii]